MPRATAKSFTLRQVFARNVRVVRVNAGISQERVADEAQLDRTFIGSLERGERNISIDNVERIAKVIGYPAHELLRPDFPEAHNLDATLTRAPRTARLYPPETRARKPKQ
ncbi:MAG: helix-turn-helix transcriptional regulator [Proteobacteria bacterium]|nr:helix-turn-helix transcriptional regulator [Variovorax sp.]MBS0429933.1 helix-turn-helix transcriptional regulator [Pseudomonadota bacterium]|tara:strand:- start:1040 stop:1369 length:330 start_codon:yes stop_codon:yes gene_type:complete